MSESASGRNQDPNSIEARLARYLAERLPTATDVVVTGLDRISGGASRETSRFVLHWREGEEARERRMILRRDPPGSLIDTDRRVEFAAYQAFHGTKVPVPEPLWLEEDPGPLDYPFFIMEELSGYEASPQALLVPPYAEHVARMAEQKWSILGEIARQDPKALGLYDVMEPVAAGDAWKRELGYWEGVIDAKATEPQPIIRAVIRWWIRTGPSR